MLASVWLFKAGPEQIEVAILVRSLLLFVALTVQVPAVAALAGMRTPRWGMAGLLAVAGVRLTLWVTTDLVYAHRLDALGNPVYGPWIGVLSLLYLILLTAIAIRSTAVGAIAERPSFSWDAGDSIMIACGPRMLCQLLTYWIVPAITRSSMHRRTAPTWRGASPRTGSGPGELAPSGGGGTPPGAWAGAIDVATVMSGL
jgi:hypothetical protein